MRTRRIEPAPSFAGGDQTRHAVGRGHDDGPSAAVVSGQNFDQQLGERFTIALDLLADFQVGESEVVLPPAAEFIPSSARSTTLRTNIPDQKDNLLDAAVGFKLDGGNNIRIVTNVILPLLDGGMRPSAIWTFGLEKVFAGGGGG